MDLASLQPSETPISFDVIHPISRKPIGLSISVFGSDSSVYRAASASRSERRMKLMKPGRIQLSSEEIQDDATAILVQSTAGWKWTEGCTFHGGVPSFDRATVEQVYRELPWVMEQVDSFIGDRSNFFTQTVTNSETTASGTSE
jgi:hypothetical protein